METTKDEETDKEKERRQAKNRLRRWRQGRMRHLPLDAVRVLQGKR